MASRKAVVLILFLCVSGWASAQGSLPPIHVLVDAEDDVAQEPVSQPTDEKPHASVDLLGLSIHETDELLDMEIRVQDIRSDGQTPIASDGRIEVAFILGDTMVSYEADEGSGTTQVTVPRDRFRLDLIHQGEGATARLMHYDISRDTYVQVHQACGTPACDHAVASSVEDASWTVPIPRDVLQDADGATPSPGLRLHGFQVVSTSDLGSTSAGAVTWTDRMPDGDVPDGEFVPELGVPPQVGHLRLSSPYPVRWSNGEETTYVYDVYLNNTRSAPDDVFLSVSDVPPGWDVQLPGTSLRVNDGQRLHLPVILSTPFSHEHGAFESFLVEATSGSDETTIGRVELGIRYAAVPHPTGHHSRVWVHAAEPGGQSFEDAVLPGDPARTDRHFMSALAPKDQPGSISARILPDASQYDFDRYEFTWRIDLEPGMRTGFDFNLSETGRLELPFMVEGGAEDAVVFGSLFLRHPAVPLHVDGLQLATFYSSEKTDIPPDDSAVLAATVHPTRQADYVPHRPAGGHVYLDVHLRIDSRPEHRTGLDRFTPHLVPGGTVDLPLDEYKDSIERSYTPLNDVSFVVQGVTKQPVNPGESVLFEFLLNNSGVANEEFDLTATSLGADWVTFVDGSHVAVPSDGQTAVRVLVTAPRDAWEGQIVGPVLEVISRNDPLARASERVHVEVDGSRNHPDMSHLLPADGDAQGGRALPAPGVPLLLAFVATTHMMRRTRRL